MITFEKIGDYGRLGNQLFQYAILKAISLKTEYEIVLPINICDKITHGQKCLLNYFKLPSCSFSENLQIDYTYIEDNEGSKDGNYRFFDENIYKIPDNTNFFGFFQNPNYYIDIRSELINELEVIDELNKTVTETLQRFNNSVVSLHIRRGDVSNGVSEEDRKWANDFSENSILYNYYTKALNLVPKNSTILLFTGGARNNDKAEDITWCKNHFKDERITVVENLSDIECFALMSRCHYNITSFSSTFGWWASFLNKNNNIIAPSNYYPSSNIDPKKVYPQNWTLI